MGSSTVEMSLDPIVLQKQTFTIQKNTTHVHFFNFSFSFCSNKMFTSLSSARLRFVQTPTPSGQHWNVVFKKKTSRAHTKKKREFLLFSTQTFFPFVSFFTKEKRSTMKKIVRERRYPERKSPFFLYFKIWWRDGVLHVSGNSQLVIICSLQIYIQHFRMQLYKD